jgi:Zn-dependent protease with chaperone function
MVESLFYILAVALSLGYPTGAEPLFFIEPGRGLSSFLGIDVPAPLLFTGLIVLFYGLWSAALYSTGLVETDSMVLRRLSRRRFFNRIFALVLFAVIVFVFHFPFAVRVPWSVTVSVALTMIPFFMMIAFNTFFSSLREVIVKRDERLPALLFFAFKAFIGFALVPMFSLLFLIDVLTQSPEMERFVAVYPVSVFFMTFGLILFFMAFIPLLLRFVFGAYPLPSETFRKELSDLAHKAKLSYADLLVLPTYGSKLGNAFIVGLFGPMRYIFFTDYLLANLKPDEIECVMAHEIGHAKRHHLPAFFFLSFTVMVFSAVFQSYLSEVGSPLMYAVFPVFSLIWFGLLGFISRRFESEADLYGAKLYGNPETFSRALLMVAAINGMPASVGGFRHFSIERRVKTVLEVHRFPPLGELSNMLTTGIRRMCFWFFISALSILLTQAFRESRQAELRERIYEAYCRVEKARGILFQQYEFEVAARELHRSIEINDKDARAHLYLSYAQLGSGRIEDSRRSLNRAAELGLIDPEDRLLAQSIERTLQTPSPRR